jgi:two-component system, NtrC family, response regulator HydG
MSGLLYHPTFSPEGINVSALPSVAPSLLVVGEDATFLQSIKSTFSGLSEFRLETSSGPEDALAYLQANPTALVILHLVEKAEGAKVLEFLQQAKTVPWPVPTVVLSERFHADQAFEMLRHGLLEYLSKPFDLSRLVYIAQNMAGKLKTLTIDQDCESGVIRALGDENPFLFLQNAVMGQLMAQVHRAAAHPATVLLTGETGTGKTRLARLIHELSPRRHESLLVVNCGSLSATLIESELFGHVRGSFTGADRDRVGKLTAVGAGTLFFDEIDALPIELQAKLLRVVDERCFEPVGSNVTEPVQARFIVASNRNLEQEVGAGRFRADLYHRLNVVSFCLPPLRESAELISPLAERFLRELASRNGSKVTKLSAATLETLRRYTWPGNVRELRNALERAVTLCPGTEIHIGDLPPAVRTPPVSTAMVGAVPVFSPSAVGSPSKEEIELATIRRALQRNRYNRLRTAADLGISRMTLYKKLHQYGLITPSLDKSTSRPEPMGISEEN